MAIAARRPRQKLFSLKKAAICAANSEETRARRRMAVAELSEGRFFK
jgi:hypothetical protein